MSIKRKLGKSPKNGTTSSGKFPSKVLRVECWPLGRKVGESCSQCCWGGGFLKWDFLEAVRKWSLFYREPRFSAGAESALNQWANFLTKWNPSSCKIKTPPPMKLERARCCGSTCNPGYSVARPKDHQGWFKASLGCRVRQAQRRN